MAAIDILNAISPVVLDQAKASQFISIATTMVSLYPSIPVARLEIATALYAAHLLCQAGILQPLSSLTFDGGSVSYQGFVFGDKLASSTWLQEFSKLVPNFYSPSVIL